MVRELDLFPLVFLSGDDGMLPTFDFVHELVGEFFSVGPGGADPTERTLFDADFFSFPAFRNDFLHGNPK